MIKKADIAVFSVIILLCVIGIVAFFVFNNDGNTVIIKQKNKTVAEFSLKENTVFELEGNTVSIEDGAAYMKYADCRDRICIEHKPIKKSGESIVCLPNGIVVEIK